MEKVLTRMPKILKDKLKRVSKKKGIAVNAQMLDILWAWSDSYDESDDNEEQ